MKQCATYGCGGRRFVNYGQNRATAPVAPKVKTTPRADKSPGDGLPWWERIEGIPLILLGVLLAVCILSAFFLIGLRVRDSREIELCQVSL